MGEGREEREREIGDDLVVRRRGEGECSDGMGESRSKEGREREGKEVVFEGGMGGGGLRRMGEYRDRIGGEGRKCGSKSRMEVGEVERGWS